MNTADIVKAIRKQRGWSQAEMGERIGIGKSQISNIEHGRNDLPSSKLLILLDLGGWKVCPPYIPPYLRKE